MDTKTNSGPGSAESQLPSHSLRRGLDIFLPRLKEIGTINNMKIRLFHLAPRSCSDPFKGWGGLTEGSERKHEGSGVEPL